MHKFSPVSRRDLIKRLIRLGAVVVTSHSPRRVKGPDGGCDTARRKIMQAPFVRWARSLPPGPDDETILDHDDFINLAKASYLEQ